MRFHPTLPMTVALGSAVVLAAAIAYWLLSDETAVNAGPPRYAAGTVTTQNATLAPVGDFDKQFNTVLENPFLPFDVRIGDKRLHLHKDPISPPAIAKQPDNTTVIQPAAPEIPKLFLPPAAARGPAAPECHGLMTVGQNQMLLIRMPGSEELQRVTIGDEIPEANAADRKWKLLGFVAGSLARWQDPDGVEQIFPVADGLNDTVGNGSAADTVVAPAPATAAAPVAGGRPRPGAPPMIPSAPGMPDVPAPGPMIPKRPRPVPPYPKKQ